MTRPDAGDAMTVYGEPIRLRDGITVTWNRHAGGLHLELEQGGRIARRDVPATTMDHPDRARRAVQQAIDAAAAELAATT